MLKDELIKYIEHPERLNEYSLSELRALMKKYPYFQIIYILFILNLKNIKDPRFEEFLRKYSVFIKDRNELFRKLYYLESIKTEGGSSKETEANNSQEEAKEKQAEEDQNTEEKNTETAEEEVKTESISQSVSAPKKRTDERKKREYTRENLGNRISETLTNQINEADKKEELDEEVNTEFFILDKASKVSDEPEKDTEEDSYQSIEDSAEQTESPEMFELDENDQEKKASEKQKQQNNKENKIKSDQYFNEDYIQIKKIKEEKDLIDQFIEKNPELKVKEPVENEQEDISQESVEEHEDLLTEKLANIYIKQKHYKKAIEAFKKLSLKYPEKSDYFAEQIKKVEKIINEQ